MFGVGGIIRTIEGCICCRCRRVVSLDDLTVFEGRDYHDTCYLQTVRTKISQLDKIAQTGQINLIENIELGDLRYIEECVRKDIENQTPFMGTSDKPIFFGNTPLGSFAVMNPPEWKRLKSLEGTKYHFLKLKESEKEFLPIFDIKTDQNGHKFCVQSGKIKNPTFQLENGNEKKLLLEKNIQNQEAEPSLRGVSKKIHESVDVKNGYVVPS